MFQLLNSLVSVFWVGRNKIMACAEKKKSNTIPT